MTISSVPEIRNGVYPDKEEGGLLTKWKVSQDTSGCKEILNGLILFNGTDKPSNGY
ncbi:hypothetical protein [Bacillus mycoides]|uniref:hypothetical protein n=1 Tax=Bacillus mycoides TaxID=1405 RepID=UPI001495E248|nr:hypothetical protein [Bacillus mycoides]